MNVEFLPEGDITTVNSSDNLYQGVLPERHPKRVLTAVISLSCILLCAVGVMIHAAAACELMKSVSGRCKEMLVAMVIPGATSHLPEISPSKNKDKPDSDKKEAGDDTSIAQYISVDLSTGNAGAMDISNETSYSPDINALCAGARPVAVQKSESDAPLVLIYHTHGTEAYAESAASAFRSSDTEKNVVAVGTTIRYVLKEAGIESIHLEEMFDSENWSAAYDTSTVAVRAALKKYPSIKYIFDVHRDCIGNDETGYIRSISQYEGFETAQLMFVCGTDQGGSNHTTWQNNLAFALQLQKNLWGKNPKLMRPIDLRCASFYQDTGNGALLAEFGTCANSLVEAKRGAVLFASSLADYIYGEDCGLDCAALMTKYCK